MAITLADFDKIWASTSPLTPYSFSESNYKQGWNFVGATPPARQMWDFLQKQNDEKAKYIVDNFLPLSGGTMTGEILRSGVTVKNTRDDTYTQYNGGIDDTSSYICIYGKNHPTNAGVINIRAYDGNSSSYFRVLSDGGLTWMGTILSLLKGTYDVSFYSFGYITSSGQALDLTFPFIAKGKDITFNSLNGTLRSYKGYLSPGGTGLPDILTGATQGTWYGRDTTPFPMFRLTRAEGWGTNGENNTLVVGELNGNIEVTATS